MRNNKKLTKPIRTKLELCKLIGISRNTLDSYLCTPGAPTKGPGGWDLGSVTSHIKARTASDSTASKVSTAFGALKARELGLKCDRLSLALERERGRYVEKAAVIAALVRAHGQLRTILEQKFIMELPCAVAGLDVCSARGICRSLYDDAIAALVPLSSELEGL